jgi:putative lipoic acid-binding regulatory protein
MSDVLAKLRVQLETMEWPSVYMYKFIVPNHPEKVDAIKAMFDDSAVIKTNTSKNANFISVSIEVVELDVDSIIEKYTSASQIQGIISL